MEKKTRQVECNRENKEMKKSVHAKESDVRATFLAKWQVYLLLYKYAYFSNSTLDVSLPNIVANLL